MKYFIIILPMVLLFNFQGLGKNYSRLEFKREGGGNKEFYISKNEFNKSLVVSITRYNFKDTTFSIEINAKELGAHIINTLKLLFAGRLEINGYFKQPSLPTGTWAHFYMVDSHSERHEILNKKIRDLLFKLESLIENKIKL